MLGSITRLLIITGFIIPVLAEDFEGVQPVSLDQPRINVVIRRQAKGPVLAAKADDEDTANIEAFLDTGASGIVFSTNTANTLGVHHMQIPGRKEDVQFEDVGVGGGSKFALTEPIYISMGHLAPGVGSVYGQTYGPMRGEIGPLDTHAGLLESLVLGNLDIVGTPAMQGRVVVMDTKDVNDMTDKIRTYIYDPHDRNFAGPGIVKTKRHVKLSFAMFKRFTKTTPPNVEGPAMFGNPFIGPNPLQPAGDPTPPIVATHLSKSITGSWLLDTGAAASMISRKQAAALGINYTAGTFGTDHPKLDGIPADKQFTMTIGGIGGSKKTAGCYLDKLALRTREGQPLVYLKAPVLVADITVKDPTSGQEFTLDGVFGMNYLVASAKVDENALLPDITDITAGPFRWIVYDQNAGVLGLD